MECALTPSQQLCAARMLLCQLVKCLWPALARILQRRRELHASNALQSTCYELCADPLLGRTGEGLDHYVSAG